MYKRQVVALVVMAATYFVEVLIDNTFARSTWRSCFKLGWGVALVDVYKRQQTDGPPRPIHLPLPAVRRFPLCRRASMPYPLDNYAASSPPRLQERNVHDRTCIQAASAHYGWPP